MLVAVLLAATVGDRLHDAVEVEAAGLLTRRKFAEALQPIGDVTTGGGHNEHVVDVPMVVIHGLVLGAFERITTQISEQGSAQFGKRLGPNMHAFGVLAKEADLPLVVAEGGHVAVVGPVKELFAGPIALALEGGH